MNAETLQAVREALAGIVAWDDSPSADYVSALDLCINRCREALAALDAEPEPPADLSSLTDANMNASRIHGAVYDVLDELSVMHPGESITKEAVEDLLAAYMEEVPKPPAAPTDLAELADEIDATLRSLLVAVERGQVEPIVELLKAACRGGWPRKLRAYRPAPALFEEDAAFLLSVADGWVDAVNFYGTYSTYARKTDAARLRAIAARLRGGERE